MEAVTRSATICSTIENSDAGTIFSVQTMLARMKCRENYIATTSYYKLIDFVRAREDRTGYLGETELCRRRRMIQSREPSLSQNPRYLGCNVLRALNFRRGNSAFSRRVHRRVGECRNFHSSTAWPAGNITRRSISEEFLRIARTANKEETSI